MGKDCRTFGTILAGLGAATVAILKSTQDGHRFGLDIMDATGLPSGTVYPTLARMEARGYVESEWEDEAGAFAAGRPRRRYYRLADAGLAAARAEAARLAEVLELARAKELLPNAGSGGS